MTKYTLNIGLNNPVFNNENTVEYTLTKAFEFIADVRNVAVKFSATERTVVIDFNIINGSLNVLAFALDQDCVALRDNETGEGSLHGDKAEAWAPFNPEYFLTI